MLIHLLADYSRHPELRRELESDPDAVFDRYEISPYARPVLLSGNREEIARLLHIEIDDVFAEQGEFIWVSYNPKILGVPEPESGPEKTRLQIRVTVQNLARNADVVFYQEGGREQVEASIDEVQRFPETNLAYVFCRARFPRAGVFGCRVTNIIRGESYSGERDNFFTVTPKVTRGK